MAGQGGHIPRFGDWKTTDGSTSTPYTMYFEDARKRRDAGGTTPPPEPPLARGNSVPPSRRADANPPKPKDASSRPRSQSTVGHGGSVPAWGQWNERNTDGGTQHYTFVFDQIREERRSAPSTPNMEQRQRPTPAQIKPRNQPVPKRFTCFGLCGN